MGDRRGRVRRRDRCRVLRPARGGEQARALILPHGRFVLHLGLHRRLHRLAQRRRAGQEVAFVSSGAVASGTGVASGLHLGKQALAAIGQPLLMARYRELFAVHGVQVAQILLTHADLADRGRFLHARRVMAELMAAGVLPIINENDTVAV